ncbi:DUF6660 family protein [Larkinella sp. C7]|uniref:DUF6660 family protein n=1 Tax=Larkinella sp. C7 TaxID=2576607 RepID=UPI0011114395|nr:DUF6660 family protein [Larkinella sp. C7]
MKSVFCLVMSLYVLFLSVLPCADGYSYVLAGDQPTQLTNDQHTHDSKSATGELCSPLCSCDCCGTVLDQPLILPHTFQEWQPVAQTVPMLTVPALPSVVLTTWQPPQLS